MIGKKFEYVKTSLQHLENQWGQNQPVAEKITSLLVENVKKGGTLWVAGSGHSGLFALEMYHRAGGASFVVPVVADFLMPNAGPPVVRILERTSGIAQTMLNRAAPRKGEMIWIASQSGINSVSVELALKAKEMGLFVVGFTSRVHSQAVESRHPSKKRLFELCDEVMDFGGYVGDASVEISDGVKAGPLSNLTAVFMGHSILTEACRQLENSGTRCIYTSVNTPEGERRNVELERIAAERDPLLR